MNRNAQKKLFRGDNHLDLNITEFIFHRMAAMGFDKRIGKYQITTNMKYIK